MIPLLSLPRSLEAVTHVDLCQFHEVSVTEILPVSPDVQVHSRTSMRDLWGHPAGFWVLVFTEAFIAFSLYGMQAILALYLADHLLQGGLMGHVWGLGALEWFVSFLYAPVGAQAMAAGITGLFLALIYATPLLGGVLADRFLGQTRTILLGALLMTAGHFLMSFDWSFVLSLGLLILGIGASGTLKAQVGSLYAIDDTRRSDAYQIYMLGVQVAVIGAPLICASLAQKAWHWGFIAAGVGMFVGFVIYLFGRPLLPSTPLHISTGADTGSSVRPTLTGREKRTTFLLLFLVPVFAVGMIPNEEIFDGYLLWGRQHYQLTLLGHAMPVSDLISFDGFISTVCAIGVLWFWRIYGKRWKEPSEITKVALGTLISAFAPLLLALGSVVSPEPHGVSLWWGVGFHTVNDIGFSMLYAIGMALFSRAAPASLNTILVGCFTLSLFVSNLMIGKFGTLLGRMSDFSFWALHSVAALAAAAVFGLCAVRYRALLAPQTSGLSGGDQFDDASSRSPSAAA